MDHKTYFDLTPAERKARAKLTAKEAAAVAAFIAAAKALPRSICIEVNDNDWGDPHLLVSKRITRGSATQVATLCKRTLCF